jgi:hypothetical protein
MRFEIYSSEPWIFPLKEKVDAFLKERFLKSSDKHNISSGNQQMDYQPFLS